MSVCVCVCAVSIEVAKKSGEENLEYSNGVMFSNVPRPFRSYSLNLQMQTDSKCVLLQQSAVQSVLVVRSGCSRHKMYSRNHECVCAVEIVWVVLFVVVLHADSMPYEELCCFCYCAFITCVSISSRRYAECSMLM